MTVKRIGEHVGLKGNFLDPMLRYLSQCILPLTAGSELLDALLQRYISCRNAQCHVSISKGRK